MQNVNKDEKNPYLVIIKGVERDIRSSDVVKDFLTDEYIYIGLGDFRSYYRPKVNRDGSLYPERIYTQEYNKKIHSELVFGNFMDKNLYDTYSFKNKEEAESFLSNNGYFRGKNLKKYYFHEKTASRDRKKPHEFNNKKSEIDVCSFLLNQIEYDDSKKKTTEYKEIQFSIKSKNVLNGVDSWTYRAFDGLNYTYGIELETINGCIFNEIAKEENSHINVSGVFDGSLRDQDGSGPWGQEYVTGVLKGDSGLSQIKQLSKLINDNCDIDKRCAYHVHIGSLKWNSEDIVFMYLLSLMIEDEVFKSMPHSRRDNQYSKKLINISSQKINKLARSSSKKSYKRSIDSIYNYIFNIVGRSGSPNRFVNKKTRHPKGYHGGYDRSKDHRYSWINFTNIIFNQRSSINDKTIEYRVHPGTSSYESIYKWLKICMGITEFVHIGKKDIIQAISDSRKISLKEILTKVYPKSCNDLITYIEFRKSIFTYDTNEEYDYRKD